MSLGLVRAARGPTATAIAALSSPKARDYLIIALLAVGSRALLVVIGAGSQFGAAADGSLHTDNIFSLFVRWDSEWYLRIATTGYDPLPLPQEVAVKPHAFFPLYPLLIRVTAALTTLEPAVAGILVSTVLFVLALFLIHEYVDAVGLPREVGLGTALLICCAPQSVVFSSVYAESTYLFLLAAAMLALRKRRYLWAGVAAALLSATRPNGILFVVFALAWAWRTAGIRLLVKPWHAPGPLLSLALAPLGLVAYWWFCLVTTGDAFAQKSAVAHGWGWAADWPWVNFARHLAGAPINRFWAWGSLLYFTASLLLLRLRMYEEFLFCLASLALVWTNVLPHSLVRYAVVLFPVFIGLTASTVKRPLLFASVAAALAGLNAFLTLAFVLHWPIAV